MLIIYIYMNLCLLRVHTQQYHCYNGAIHDITILVHVPYVLVTHYKSTLSTWTWIDKAKLKFGRDVRC